MSIFDGATLPGQARLDRVLPAALAAVGLGSDHQARELLELPRVERACVVMVDGLGFENLLARRGHAPHLRSLGITTAISTIVPSTTAAGITAFGTGCQPGLTAMTGYSLRVPGTERTFSLIKWPDPEVSVESWQTQPTLFEKLGDQVNKTVTVQPKKFCGSGLSVAALRGARHLYAHSLEDRIRVTSRALATDAQLAYLYWGEIDAAGHKFGWCSEAWISELERFDAGVGLLRRMLPAGTLLIITADHGMIDVENRVDIAQTPQLRRGVDVVAGEPRAVHLYTREPEEVATRWQEFLTERAWVATRQDVIASGIIGPVREFTRQTMGDVIVFARDAHVFVDSRVQSSTAIGLIGVHGSLTQTEMSIPLIAEVI
ncbi:alkaline phosphatase family protein [Arcanobacterium buesumense]|uniref:Alkaline phosphatase family protein n=1 Tax=Arcanobacterium buesumense TaxID=2722751 RepID=A0A6H2EL20_9ACTO|nr:alkaline phosphatase family protein [Arcanobacterium buesumense]QJC21689.1 alkaline phosphatase family protein [Arcanobacterium buesumense]